MNYFDDNAGLRMSTEETNDCVNLLVLYSILNSTASY